MTTVGFIQNAALWQELKAWAVREHGDYYQDDERLGFRLQHTLERAMPPIITVGDLAIAKTLIKMHVEEEEQKDMESDEKREQALEQIREWIEKDSIPIKALALLCHAWWSDADMRRAIKELPGMQGNRGKLMARAVEYFPNAFTEQSIWDGDRDYYECIFAIARLPRDEAQGFSMQLGEPFFQRSDEVRARVQSRLAELNPRKHDRPLAELCADLAEYRNKHCAVASNEGIDLSSFVTPIVEHKSVLGVLKKRGKKPK